MTRVALSVLMLSICFAFAGISFAQATKPIEQQFIFLPGRLAAPPLTASYHEPRIGLRKEFSTSKLKVDIGGSIDMLEYRPSSDSTKQIRLGIEFFTYALSTNADGLRLQIDAVDGFFGGHVVYVNDISAMNRFILRLRLLHLSAHFLDGHYSNATKAWKDGREPIPFTRDFGELIAAYRCSSNAIHIQPYIGFSYATLIRPTNIKRFEYHGGIELWSDKLVQSVFGKPFNLYVAEHISLRGIPTFIGTTNVEFGVKFGEWASTGLKIFVSYYNGLEVFSQYYDVRRENWGLGFAFDFW